VTVFEAGMAGLMGQALQHPQAQQIPWSQPGYYPGYYPTHYTYSTGISAERPKDAEPEPIKGRHFTTMITDDLVDSPEEPPTEEPPSEFKELSNHAFHKLLQEFTDLTQLCVQSIK